MQPLSGYVGKILRIQKTYYIKFINMPTILNVLKNEFLYCLFGNARDITTLYKRFQCRTNWSNRS